jgi:DNA-binding FrmR family transcriptional regulator
MSDEKKNKNSIAGEHVHERIAVEEYIDTDRYPHTTHPHTHVHDPKEKKRQINRIARIIGHLEYVKRMIENDNDCSEVLMQIAASRSALNGLGKEIINEHMSHCIAHALEEGDMKSVEEFQEAIKRYL